MRVVARRGRGRLQKCAPSLRPPAVIAQGHQRRAACQRRDAGLAGCREARAKEAADGARADYTDFQHLGSRRNRKSTRLNSSHLVISYAVFCLKKKKIYETDIVPTRATQESVR